MFDSIKTSLRWLETILLRRKTIDATLTQMKETPSGLKKVFGFWDLTAFGIAGVLGAGVFATIGEASAAGGPAVILLYLFTAIACGFSALCYAEFASSLPSSGSAYSYAYSSFGELFAWIIGWNLIMEYAISNITVAISWSEYFCRMLSGYGIHCPSWLSMDYFSAKRAAQLIDSYLQEGLVVSDIALKKGGALLLRQAEAWNTAPYIAGIKLICNLPVLGITALITAVVYMGIEESKKLSNLFVMLKIGIVLMVITIGATYVKPENWIPFAPNGASGILKGVSSVFFAYIGFDAISSTAEECHHPQRDLPRAMIATLLICTLLYILVALVLTGIIPYHELAVGDPLAHIFGAEGANLPWISGIVEIGAMIALSSILLVYQVGQPRIWMSMSRDGLLPRIFSALHPVYRTPWFSVLLTGVIIGIPSLFLNLEQVTELASIGTLSAFLLVCAGVLKLNPQGTFRHPDQRFQVPYIDSKWIFPGMIALTSAVGFLAFPAQTRFFFLRSGHLEMQQVLIAGFCVYLFFMSLACFKKRLSLIPVLGVTSCLYLLVELGWAIWTRFFGWLLLGILIYICYGTRHSRLNQNSAV